MCFPRRNIAQEKTPCPYRSQDWVKGPALPQTLLIKASEPSKQGASEHTETVGLQRSAPGPLGMYYSIYISVFMRLLSVTDSSL